MPYTQTSDSFLGGLPNYPATPLSSPPLLVSSGTHPHLLLLIILFTFLPACFPLDPKLWEGRAQGSVASTDSTTQHQAWCLGR